MKRKFQKKFKTTEGHTVLVRRMLPADVNHLVTIYRRLSPESLYLRFQGSGASLSPIRILNEARTLTETGYRRGQGFLAFVDIPHEGVTPVAGARYIRTDPRTAEISITVRDDFQKQGIGKNLLAILVEEAGKEGVAKFVANINANNRSVLRLLAHWPYPTKRKRYGPEIVAEMDIPPATSRQERAMLSKRRLRQLQTNK